MYIYYSYNIDFRLTSTHYALHNITNILENK